MDRHESGNDELKIARFAVKERSGQARKFLKGGTHTTTA
jgi:hypothetical protein